MSIQDLIIEIIGWISTALFLYSILAKKKSSPAPAWGSRIHNHWSLCLRTRGDRDLGQMADCFLFSSLHDL